MVFNLRDNVRDDLWGEVTLRDRRVVGEQARVVSHQRQALGVRVPTGMGNDNPNGAEAWAWPVVVIVQCYSWLVMVVLI